MARPIAKDHDEKRAQILNTAAQVFAAEGYDRASMNQIAAACGISKANIYHYYTGKDALLFDLLDNYLSDLRDRVCSAPDLATRPEDQLAETVRAVLRAYQGANDHHRVQVSALGALPEEKQKILRAYQRDMVAHLSGILSRIAPQTLGDDARKLRSVTMSVFGMLNWYYMWNSGAGSAAREEYAQLVTKMTLNGLQGV